MELNKPQGSQSLLFYFVPFRLCFEQLVSFNILQDKAASYSAGKEQSSSFYLPLSSE